MCSYTCSRRPDSHIANTDLGTRGSHLRRWDMQSASSTSESGAAAGEGMAHAVSRGTARALGCHTSLQAGPHPGSWQNKEGKFGVEGGRRLKFLCVKWGHWIILVCPNL